jgi:hypothetical protein
MEARREIPGGFNFPRPDIGAAPASPAPICSQTYPNLSGQSQSPSFDQQADQGFLQPGATAQNTAGFQPRSDRRPIFDDKIASPDIMKYLDAKKSEWLKTTRNYLISRAIEMKHYLPWAEGFQSSVIIDDHVRALATSGVCSDNEPLRLSFELWGHTNLCLHGEEKIAFNNVYPGNGFDAWRRLVVPIGLRSEAQLHRMHKNVYGPPTSRRLGDVLSDLDKWEGTLSEF